MHLLMRLRSVSFGEIDAEGASTLAAALERNSTLTELK
jgi:hypothetical protein